MNADDKGTNGRVDHFSAQSLRFERILDAPIERVWQFLVDPALRARWFMGGPTELRVGGTQGLTMYHDLLSDEDDPMPERYRAYAGTTWTERITRLDPPRLLAFLWDDGKAGEVCFELSPLGERTRLVLTHDGLRDRDDAVNFGGGWHSHLAVLERRLRGESVPSFWALHAQAEALARQAFGPDETR